MKKTIEMELGLWHGGSNTQRTATVAGRNPTTYMGCIVLLDELFPALPRHTHGTKLRVTVEVEVIAEGVECPVRKWKDTGCQEERGL